MTSKNMPAIDLIGYKRTEEQADRPAEGIESLDLGFSQGSELTKPEVS